MTTAKELPVVRSGAHYVVSRMNRTAVMGIVNVTPDSFSDGGNWETTQAAVRQGLELASQGADIVDVGGESTRPGAGRVSPATEAARVVPVVAALHEQGVLVSVDTMRADIAEACVRVGAAIINDVSGGLADPEMPRVAAESGAAFVAMHWRGHSDRMANFTTYSDVITEVKNELYARVEALLLAGVRHESLILDPGLGFSKNAPDNWRLLANLEAFDEFKLPILVGASRKRFLGELLAAGEHDAATRADPAARKTEPGELGLPQERDAATAAISLLSARTGVWGVRVHDVRSSRQSLQVLDAWDSSIVSR